MRLTGAERAELEKALKKEGSARKLSAALGVSRMTLARIKNGQAVNSGTVDFIKAALRGGEAWELFVFHMEAAKRTARGVCATSYGLRVLNVIKENTGYSLRKIAEMAGVKYLALHRYFKGRAVSCLFVWELLPKLSVFVADLSWLTYKDSIEYKEQVKNAQPQYAQPQPAQPQYAQPQYAEIPPAPVYASTDEFLAGVTLKRTAPPTPAEPEAAEPPYLDDEAFFAALRLH